MSLELKHSIGWNPSIKGGLIQHPDQRNYIVASGATVVVTNLKNPTQQVFLEGHAGTVLSLTASSQGTLVASGEDGENSDVCVWDYATKQLKYRLMKHRFGIQSLAFSNDERFLSTLGKDKKLYVWDMQNGKIVAQAATSSAVDQICFGGRVKDYSGKPTCMYRVAGVVGQQLQLWTFDPASGQVTPDKMREGPHRRQYTCMAWSADYETLYCGSTSGDITVLEVACGKVQPTINVNCGAIATVNTLMDSTMKKLFIGGTTGNLTVLEWDGRDWVDMQQTDLASSVTHVTKFGPSTCLVGTDNGLIYQVDVRTLQHSELASSHVGKVTAIQFIPRSTAFATASLDGTIKVWDGACFRTTASMKIPSKPLCLDIAPSNKGAIVVSGWEDGYIRAMNVRTGELDWDIPNAHETGVRSLRISSNGKFCASGGGDGAVRIWDLASRMMVSHLKEHYKPVNEVAIYDDNLHVLSVSKDKTMLCWDLGEEKRIASHAQRAGGMNAVALSLDQSIILTAGQEKTITFWSLRQPEPLDVLPTPDHVEVYAIAVSGDGTLFATGGTDGKLALWDMASKRISAVNKGFSSCINKIAFSPDNKQVISVGSLGNIDIFNVR